MFYFDDNIKKYESEYSWDESLLYLENTLKNYSLIEHCRCDGFITLLGRNGYDKTNCHKAHVQRYRNNN